MSELLFAGNFPPFQLRPMQVADIAAVMAMEAAAHPDPFKEAGYLKELTDNDLAHYVMLCHHDAIIGQAGYWLIADELHISTVLVEKGWQGRGLGAYLLLHLLAMAASSQPILATLEVRESNQPAISLYQRYGFEIVGRRKRYYKNEDAILMTLEPLDDAHYAQLAAKWDQLKERLSTLVGV